jgi:hypothetical protein
VAVTPIITERILVNKVFVLIDVAFLAVMGCHLTRVGTLFGGDVILVSCLSWNQL